MSTGADVPQTGHKHRQPPPPFIDGNDYKSWKRKVKMWVKISKCPLEDQAPIVRLQCFQEHPIAERSLERFEIEDLKKEDGLDILLAELDNVFLDESMNEKWMDFLKVFNFERDTQCLMAKFIIDFEHNWAKMSANCSSAIPTELMGSFLMHKANIPASDAKLVTATCPDLKYKEVKVFRVKKFSRHFHIADNLSVSLHII